jgi:hypothetical protein
VHEAQRQRAHHVGQGAAGAGRLDLGGQLVFGDGHDLDLDAGLLLEGGGDVLGGLDPLGDVLGGPEGDGLVAAVAAFVATAAAAGHSEQHAENHQGRQTSRSHVRSSQPAAPAASFPPMRTTNQAEQPFGER